MQRKPPGRAGDTQASTGKGKGTDISTGTGTGAGIMFVSADIRTVTQGCAKKVRVACVSLSHPTAPTTSPRGTPAKGVV